MIGNKVTKSTRNEIKRNYNLRKLLFTEKKRVNIAVY